VILKQNVQPSAETLLIPLEIRELMPQIMEQLGKRQLEALKNANINLTETPKEEVRDGGEGEGEGEDDSDSDGDIPDLVGENFEETSKLD